MMEDVKIEHRLQNPRDVDQAIGHEPSLESG